MCHGREPWHHSNTHDTRCQHLFWPFASHTHLHAFANPLVGRQVGADLEAGMYYGGGDQTIVNNNSFPLTSDFVSLHLKGRNDSFALKGGDATKGPLVTTYDGPRPDPKLACCVRPPWSYQPMQKQGAIILGTGGDNSNGAEGNFYEGVLCCCAATCSSLSLIRALSSCAAQPAL
jgi:hypothetical protein